MFFCTPFETFLIHLPTTTCPFGDRDCACFPCSYIQWLSIRVLRGRSLHSTCCGERGSSGSAGLSNLAQSSMYS